MGMVLFLMCAPWVGNLPCYCRNVPKLINDPNVSCDCPWGQQQGNADDPPFSCSCNPGHPLSVGVQCGVGAVRSGGGAVVAA